MKPAKELLVLGRSDLAQDWALRFRHNRHRRRDAEPAALDDALARACEGVLVVNDRSAVAVDHLNWARRLQAQRPRLAVAVLTVIDAGDANDPLEAALALAPPAGPGHPAQLDTAQAMAILAPHLRGLRVCDTEAGISFEYAG